MTLQERLDRRFAGRYNRLTTPIEERWLGATREELLRGVTGDVLELGPGTGHNRSHYPAGLRSLTLVEPSAAMRELLAARYDGFLPAPVILPDTAEDLSQVADGCVDVVVATLVLCSVADPARCLAEVRRVLRPGGRLVVIEHVRGTGLHAWFQDRITPLTVRFAAGCHNNRDTVAELRAAGFDVAGVTDSGQRMTPLVFPVVTGIASLM